MDTTGKSSDFPLTFSPQSPELDSHIDVVACTPGPARLSMLADADESRDSSSTTSGPGTSVTSLDPNESRILDENQKRYFCQRCLNHRLEFPRKGHKPSCQYAQCQCEDCIMVEKRRQLNNQLSQRRLDPGAPRPEPGKKKIRDPKCARCSAHGEKQALRGHKRNLCPFRECGCQLCKLVENRRMLMARQIKLRRDQQKARKAQQVVDDIEQIVRESIISDMLPLNPIKKPQKPSATTPKKTNKTIRQKTSPKSTNVFEAAKLVRSQIETRQDETDKNDENQRGRLNGNMTNMTIPMPVHPMALYRPFKTNNGCLPPMPFFPALIQPPPTFIPSLLNNYPSLFPMVNNQQPKPQTSSSNVVSPANSSSSLPSPTSPPQQQQANVNNNSPPLAPLFNKLIIGNNNGEKAVPTSGAELSPLQQMQLLQQQFFGSLNPVDPKNVGRNHSADGSPPDLSSDDSNKRLPNQELISMIQKQILANQQQQHLNSPPATSANNGFAIAPDILQQLAANPSLSGEWLRSMQQQVNPTANPLMAGNFTADQEQSQMIQIPIAELKRLIQLAAKAKQN